MADSDASGARILLVEDEGDLAEVVQLNLELAGYAVDIAVDGVEAMAHLAQHVPDLVLLDVMLPRVDGWEVLRALKSETPTRDVPVIMLTALTAERDHIQGYLEGAVRYLTKPFDVDVLLTTVAEVLRPPDQAELEARRERTRVLVQRLAELDAGRSAAPSVRLSHLETPPKRRAATDAERDRLAELTGQQRRVAAELAAGRSAREVADVLGVSRSNIYATRKRVARKLGVAPEEVAEVARRLGL